MSRWWQGWRCLPRSRPRLLMTRSNWEVEGGAEPSLVNNSRKVPALGKRRSSHFIECRFKRSKAGGGQSPSFRADNFVRSFPGDFEVIAFVLAGNKNQSHGPMTLVGLRSRRGSNLFGTREASADQDHAYNGTVVTMPSPGRHRCDLAPGPCLAMTAMWQRSATERHAALFATAKELVIMALIVLFLFIEMLLAILLPGPNMGAPMRFLLGIRQGEPH